MALPFDEEALQRLLSGTVPAESAPAVDPAVRDYVAAMPDRSRDPTTRDQLSAALAADRKGQRGADTASLIMQAGQSYANQRQAPREQRNVDDQMKEFVLGRQIDTQDQASAAAKEKAKLDALKTGADIYKTQAEIGKTRAETGKIGLEGRLVGHKLEPANPQVVEMAKSFGFNVPEGATTSDVFELVDPALKARGLSLDWAKYGLDRDRLQLDRDKANRDKPKASDDLRKEFQALQTVKDMQNTAATYEKIRTASPSGPGDISMIFAFMKMIDPGSTVREGEFATAENSGGVPSKVVNTYNKILRGDKLPPEIRAQFRSEAKSLYDAQRQRYDATAKEYQRLAEQSGLAPGDVVLDVLGSDEGGGRSGSVSAAPTDAGPRQISSDAEYEALPPGTQYVAPDGSTRTKRGR